MVYAEFVGQTECIMGNWKIENDHIILKLYLRAQLQRALTRGTIL